MTNPACPRTVLDKATILDGLFGEWDALDALLAELTEEQWQRPTALPEWTVHDVVAHVIGTELMLGGMTAPDVDVSGLAHVKNPIGAMNEQWVLSLRSLSGAEVLERFRAVIADRRKVLSDMTGEDWNAVTATPAGPDSFGRFMRVRIFDCWMHEDDIREAVGLPPGDLAGPAARLALEEMTSSLGFVVGKLGGAPDGSRVEIELTGPLARTVRIAVDGRASVVDEFAGADPTITIRLDGLLFTRLAGGRTSVDHAAIAYGGDEAAGRRIVEHLHYVP